jgi:hypothetical protein
VPACFAATEEYSPIHEFQRRNRRQRAEGAGEDGLELGRQRLLQPALRSQPPGLRRGGHHAWRVVGLLDAKALDLAKEEDEPELRWKIGDRLLEPGSDLASHGSSSGEAPAAIFELMFANRLNPPDPAPASEANA